MKKITSVITSLVIALNFATILSCSEQDENPVALSNLSSGSTSSGQTSKRQSTAGRVGDEIFDGSEGDPIDLTTAKSWTANYRSKNPDEILGHYFGYEIIQQILKQAGCVGIRMYYANDENGDRKLLIVGVDAAGNDMVPTEGGENIIGDYSYPCPDYCPNGVF